MTLGWVMDKEVSRCVCVGPAQHHPTAVSPEWGTAGGGAAGSTQGWHHPSGMQRLPELHWGVGGCGVTR